MLCSAFEHSVLPCSCAVDARAQFKVQEWTEAEYQAELEHIEKVRSMMASSSVLPKYQTVRGLPQ
jgi:hypothetical protein